MQSRLVREGAVGLLILGGLISFGGLFAWIYNIGPARRGYSFDLRFEDARGLAPGASVRLRGVRIGRVQEVTPGADHVDVTVVVDSSIQIPRQSTFSTSQTGLVGETAISIIPEIPLPAPIPETMRPVGDQCDADLIVCAGEQVAGQSGADYARLVTSLNLLAVRLNNDELFTNINRTLAGISTATETFSTLAGTLNRQAQSLRLQDLNLKAFSDAGTSTQKAADEFRLLIAENRRQLRLTVDNVAQLSANLKEASDSLKPLLTDPQLQASVRTTLENVTQASENVVAVTRNLQELSTTVNDPALILSLRQTLDSARITFQNAQKITADLDQLTGDPQFRESLKNLVKGLSGLVSQAPEALPGSLLTTPTVALTPDSAQTEPLYALVPLTPLPD